MKKKKGQKVDFAVNLIFKNCVVDVILQICGYDFKVVPEDKVT